MQSLLRPGLPLPSGFEPHGIATLMLTNERGSTWLPCASAAARTAQPSPAAVLKPPPLAAAACRTRPSSRWRLWAAAWRACPRLWSCLTRWVLCLALLWGVT